MKKTIVGKAIGITSLTLFLAYFSGIGWSQSLSPDESSAVSLSVTLQEWFILEVADAGEAMTSDGSSSAGVTTTLNSEGVPVRIRAFASVNGIRKIELRAQVMGDLVNPHGEVLPLSKIASDGAGFHEGSVCYFSLRKGPSTGDYTQRIVYSLAAL